MTRIRLNVGGMTYVTTQETLNTYPDSRLGRLTPTDPSYDGGANEYYFDRNALFFHYALEYYRTGHLHIPRDMCSAMVRAEMAFWELEKDNVADCCIDHYDQHELDEENIKVLIYNNLYLMYIKYSISAHLYLELIKKVLSVPVILLKITCK